MNFEKKIYYRAGPFLNDMRTINNIALKRIAEKYNLDTKDLGAYIDKGVGKNAFHLAVCISQHFNLGPVWEEIRYIIHKSEQWK